MSAVTIPAVCQRAHSHTEENTYRLGFRKECKDCRRLYWRNYARKIRDSSPARWRVATEPEELEQIALANN